MSCATLCMLARRGWPLSRSESHATSDDRPVASRLATWDEVVALVRLVVRESTGIFEISGEPAPLGNPDGRQDYQRRLQELALSSGVPTVFGIFASPTSSGLLPVIEDTVARGGHMYGLTHCRGVSTLQSFAAHLSFDRLPEWQDIRARALDEQRKLLQEPDIRKRLVAATHDADYGQRIARGRRAHRTTTKFRSCTPPICLTLRLPRRQPAVVSTRRRP